MELKGQCDMKEVDSDGIRDNEEKVHVNIRSTKVRKIRSHLNLPLTVY